MADRVDASMEEMQPPTREAFLNRAPAQAMVEQLTTAHDSVLALRNLSNPVIRPDRPTRTAFAPYSVVNAVLVWHKTIVP